MLLVPRTFPRLLPLSLDSTSTEPSSSAHSLPLLLTPQLSSLSEVPRGFSSIDDFLAGHSLSDRPASPRGRLHHTQLVNLEACEDEHGNALVSCVMDKAGSYLLHISLQHQQIRLVGSPLHVHVVPAAASGPQSKLLTSAAELSLNAGERRALRIQGVDRCGLSGGRCW